MALCRMFDEKTRAESKGSAMQASNDRVTFDGDGDGDGEITMQRLHSHQIKLYSISPAHHQHSMIQPSCSDTPYTNEKHQTITIARARENPRTRNQPNRGYTFRVQSPGEPCSVASKPKNRQGYALILEQPALVAPYLLHLNPSTTAKRIKTPIHIEHKFHVR